MNSSFPVEEVSRRRAAKLLQGSEALCQEASAETSNARYHSATQPKHHSCQLRLDRLRLCIRSSSHASAMMTDDNTVS